MLQTGELLVQPGLVQTLEALAEEGAESVYRGSLAEALLRIDGVVFTADDLRSYSARWADPGSSAFTSTAWRREAVFPACPSSYPVSPPRGPVGVRPRPRGRRRRSRRPTQGGEHTTNMVAVDGHGRACVLTHSLGVGAGVWVPGFDLQLNNLLGESDIASGDPKPGDHLQSRMAPSLAFDDSGLALAIGAAAPPA